MNDGKRRTAAYMLANYYYNITPTVITEIFLHTSQTTPTIGLHTSHTTQQAQTPFLITAKSIITETSPKNI